MTVALFPVNRPVGLDELPQIGGIVLVAIVDIVDEVVEPLARAPAFHGATTRMRAEVASPSLFRMVDQVEAKLGAGADRVDPACMLDQAGAAELVAVAGNGVAELLAQLRAGLVFRETGLRTHLIDGC